MRTPAQGRATESDQSFLPLLTELPHPFPSHLALWIELPGAFSPPRDGGEDRSKEAKPTRSSAGLGGELGIPGLGPGAQPLPEPAHPETRAMGTGIAHLVLVAGWDGEDGAAVHLPHEELGHAVTRGIREGSAERGRAVTSRAVTHQHPTRTQGTRRGPGRWEMQQRFQWGSAQLHVMRSW